MRLRRLLILLWRITIQPRTAGSSTRITTLRQSDPHPTFVRSMSQPVQRQRNQMPAWLMSSGAIVGVLRAIAKKHAEAIGELIERLRTERPSRTARRAALTSRAELRQRWEKATNWPLTSAAAEFRPEVHRQIAGQRGKATGSRFSVPKTVQDSQPLNVLDHLWKSFGPILRQINPPHGLGTQDASAIGV
jgi:hypothetical protein